MERTTSSGVDGRSRDAMRKKKDISALAVPFPCRVAGGQTAGRGRGVIMHTGVNVQGRGHGRSRAVAIATPFCLLCIWPRKAFATNPLPVNTILLFTPDYS
jgi:hypothetical protein